MKRIADEQGRTLQDVHLAFIKYANGRGNLWLTQGLKGFAPLPRFEETTKENPTMKRKPTPAQIAARERFAEMARSGAFKRKAKRNPAKKTVSQKISQLTREGYPQKQAVAIALSEERAGKVKRNPRASNPIILVSDKAIKTRRKSNPAKYRDTARGLPENRVLYSVHLATQRPSIASGGMFTSKQNAMRVAQVIADSTGKTYAVSRLERK
ncbi:MAG: hypothetical protein EB121_05175 [Alphaproteobacteria bacterium]|nr:hypothetical protein [Alphaproteobacteria bacterium]